jgi:hypothetical protein
MRWAQLAGLTNLTLLTYYSSIYQFFVHNKDTLNNRDIDTLLRLYTIYLENIQRVVSLHAVVLQQVLIFLVISRDWVGSPSSDFQSWNAKG